MVIGVARRPPWSPAARSAVDVVRGGVGGYAGSTHAARLQRDRAPPPCARAREVRAPGALHGGADVPFALPGGDELARVPAELQADPRGAGDGLRAGVLARPRRHGAAFRAAAYLRVGAPLGGLSGGGLLGGVRKRDRRGGAAPFRGRDRRAPRRARPAAAG